MHQGTYPAIAPEDESLPWFSLPTPRLAHPSTLRRTPEADRDWESESESPLAVFPGTKEETPVAVVLILTVRCCSAWDANIGAGEAEGAGAGAGAGFGAANVATSGPIDEGDKEILTARCGCG